MDFFRKGEKGGVDSGLKSSNASELPELPSSTMPELPELPSLPSTSEEELPEQKEEMPRVRRTVELSEMRDIRSQILRKEPVFIKIDKFQEVMKKLEEIKEKTGEIDGSLAKLRDIKNREEQELKSWEQEVRLIKEKIASIDNSFSNKL
jgi:chromosome segregation ATPase